MSTTAIAFDTHKFIKGMMATGFTEEQAETQAHLFSEILDSQLATKGDIELAKAELRKEIEVAKNETIRWMVGLALAQLAMMAGILMTLVRVLPGGH